MTTRSEGEVQQWKLTFETMEGKGEYSFQFMQNELVLKSMGKIPSFKVPYRWIKLIDIRDLYPFKESKFGIEFIPEGRLTVKLGKIWLPNMRICSEFLGALESHGVDPKKKIVTYAVPSMLYTPELLHFYSPGLRKTCNTLSCLYSYVMAFGSVFFILEMMDLLPNLGFWVFYDLFSDAYSLVWSDPQYGIPLVFLAVVLCPAYLPVLGAFCLASEGSQYLIALSFLTHCKTFVRMMGDLRLLCRWTKRGKISTKAKLK